MTEDCREASFFEMEDWPNEEETTFTFTEFNSLYGFWPY